MVSSAGVTRPSRPGIDPEQEPPAVKMNAMLGGILDFKLAGAWPPLGPACHAVQLVGRGSCCRACPWAAPCSPPPTAAAPLPSPPLPPPPAEDALRGSGVPFAIVRPVALTEEAGGMPVKIEQGDTLKGKISREVRAAAPALALEGLPAAGWLRARWRCKSAARARPCQPPSSSPPPTRAQDIADLCVALLDTPAAADTTFEVGSTVPFSQPWEGVAAAPPRDWAATLREAGLRRRVTGKTIDGVYTGREPEPEPAAAAPAAAAAK